MKIDVFRFVLKCLTCPPVKFEPQRLGGQLQPLGIAKWKWVNLTCDVVGGLPKIEKNNDAIWEGGWPTQKCNDPVQSAT